MGEGGFPGSLAAILAAAIVSVFCLAGFIAFLVLRGM
jgi:hypothetical protein